MTKTGSLPLCRVSKAYLLSYINAPRSWPGDAEVRFECGGTLEARDEAFAALRIAAAGWQGIDALAVSREDQSHSEASLVIPACLFGSYGELAGIFHGLAAQAGLRANTLAMLNTEAAPRLSPWLSWSAQTTTTSQRADIAACQTAWANRLGHYIALDAAAGSCAHPDLIRELHIGLPPLEHMVCRALLACRSSIRRSVRIDLHHTEGFNFGLVPTAELAAALDSLGAHGWVADPEWRLKPTPGYYLVGRGPLARKLSAYDLLRLGA